VDGELGPQWTWNPADSAGTWRKQFLLPVPVRTVAIKAPGAQRLLVHPVRIVGSTERIAHSVPDRVARYGPAVVFLLNGRAFMEPGGTWVEGGESADFVIGADAGAVRLLVRNPPVPNVVTLEGDQWRQSLILAAGEERIITLPFPANSQSLAVRVTARHGARPSEFERGSSDTRFLGCWIETRP